MKGQVQNGSFVRHEAVEERAEYPVEHEHQFIVQADHEDEDRVHEEHADRIAIHVALVLCVNRENWQMTNRKGCPEGHNTDEGQFHEDIIELVGD